jgi:HEAT repeat protein
MSRLALSTLLTALVACASVPGLDAAERGDRAALKDAVARHEKVGDLSNAEATSLALVVAERELREAKGPDAIERVRDAWPCAHELDDALAARMEEHDDVGAQAALARVDGRGLDAGDVRTYLVDPDSAWRAVGTRGLVRQEDRAARVHALVDPDPRVRRQAVRAARDATDPNDLEPLVEVARTDPEPIVRTEAVRAVSSLSPLPREDVANVLRDLWASADAGLREDIALAWAEPAVWDAGGREALRVVVASEHGPGAVEGAAAVLRHKDVTGDVAMAATAQLVRAIEQGPHATRLQAIAQSPLDRPELLDAVKKAAADGAAEVQIGALARLAEEKAPGAVEKLEAFAQPGSPVAVRARFALASLGDRRVQAWIEQDLASESAPDRLSAATALASLGVAARAAPLLADGDPSVRTRAACTILMAARRR